MGGSSGTRRVPFRSRSPLPSPAIGSRAWNRDRRIKPDDGQTFRLFARRSTIVQRAALAALFMVRARMSAVGVASLSGPGWTIFNALLAVAFTILCFDRVVVAPTGITITRGGIPRRFAPERIHQLVVVDKDVSWPRLYAETVDGKRTLIVTERRNARSQMRMRELMDHTQVLLGSGFQPLATDAVTDAVVERGVSREGVKRRCVRTRCPAYLTEVVAASCDSCGDSTQRVFG